MLDPQAFNHPLEVSNVVVQLLQSDARRADDIYIGVSPGSQPLFLFPFPKNCRDLGRILLRFLQMSKKMGGTAEIVADFSI